MQRRVSGRVQLGYLLGLALVLSAFLALAVRQGSAKDQPQNECLASFTDVPPGNENGGTFMCNDCDPRCDQDGVNTPNQSCTFKGMACVNKPSGSCLAAAALKTIKGKVQGGGTIQITKPAGSDSACGAFTATVKLKKKGKKPGKATVKLMVQASGKPNRKDKDVLTLVCNPQPAATCPTTTTTTLPVAICNNGTIEAPEVCDPPFTQGGCPSGQICSGDCTACMPCSTSNCACGTPAKPSQLQFTTSPPDIGTKECVGGASPPHTPCNRDQDCATGDSCSSCPTTDGTVVGTVKDDSGATLCNLRSGGLYFGGSGVGVPLPAAVPDMGTSFNNVGCCLQDGTSMQLLATTKMDTMSAETCTSAAEDNGVYAGKPGCLFGPPLPIANTAAPGLSTCIVNRVAQDAAGLANCTTGSAQLNIPLTSDTYLTGDVLPKRCANTTNPNDVGRQCAMDSDCPGGTCVDDSAKTQPCPICNPTTLKCNGGPNDVAGSPAVACVPGSGTLGDGYPTSHGCPPPPGSIVGGLPIPFALSTGQQAKESVDLDIPFTFCGFCASAGGATNENPPHPCTSSAQCTKAPFTSCRQRDPGAFNQGAARTITEMGVAGTNLTDHNPHDSRLVSVFCIPPSYNPAVDAAGDLPGPGAVSLPGKAQLLP